MVHLIARDVTIAYPVIGLNKPEERVRSDGSGRGDVVARQKRSFILAVDNFNVDLRAGARLGIIGRNGSGKSTILRALAGIYTPTAGTVETQGQISSLLNVGLGTRAESTGRQNIYLRGYMRGLNNDQIAEVEQEIIDFSELGDFIDMPVRTYSSGMAMRLSFSIATTFSPEILLLDEWIGVGDRDFQEKARDRMKSLLEFSGITVLCSHNTRIIREACNRVIWLDKGRTMMDGAPEDVLAQYENARRVKRVPQKQIENKA